MKAINFDHPGEADVLELVDLPIPLLKKKSNSNKSIIAGVNRPDIVQRLGNYPAPEGHSKILGLEISGKSKILDKKLKNLKRR